MSEPTKPNQSFTSGGVRFTMDDCRVQLLSRHGVRVTPKNPKEGRYCDGLLVYTLSGRLLATVWQDQSTQECVILFEENPTLVPNESEN